MPDFLLELRSEEIPARMQAKAQEDLARLFAAETGKVGLEPHAIETFATPRRLALIARALPAAIQGTSEELKGPRTSAPSQALVGFLRKTGLSRDQLVDRNGIWFATIEKPGRATVDLLGEAVPALVRAFPWPKSMRWGAASVSTESARWVRPLQGIVALFGEDIVEFEIAGIHAGAATVGHRFHHPGVITIGSANDYIEKLRACHVIVDPLERQAIIREGAEELAAGAGLFLVADEGLVVENAGLTEWPVPLLGAFDPAFLEVPPEVIRLTMRTNQKYFALTDASGVLAPNFICTANIAAADGGAAVVAGNRKVLAARLSDAKFFWEQDLKILLTDQTKKLSQIVFHEKLGTVADKVERVARLARWLVDEGIIAFPEGEGSQDHLATLAERAARLCKADLVTQMVGEFPELQGIIGGHLARAQGEDPRVADAVRDHYKPVGLGDEVPTAPVTVAVSLADKLDTLSAFFIIGEAPTGSKDPFALRRAALSVIRLILHNHLRLRLGRYLSDHMLSVKSHALVPHTAAVNLLKEFLTDRLKVQQREAYIRHDLIDAVFALEAGREDDLVRLLARVNALQAFVETTEGADLFAGYKRAANILKKEGRGSISPLSSGSDESLSYAPLPEEAALIAALDVAEPSAVASVKAEDFAGAMAALASLRGPVDAFFDKVTVNDPDPARREARLNLLARMRDAVHRVADFSRIEG